MLEDLPGARAGPRGERGGVTEGCDILIFLLSGMFLRVGLNS